MPPAAAYAIFQGLPIDGEGVEIEVAGKVCYKVIPPNQLSEAEKKS
jgi:hypothetical protein